MLAEGNHVSPSSTSALDLLLLSSPAFGSKMMATFSVEVPLHERPGAGSLGNSRQRDIDVRFSKVSKFLERSLRLEGVTATSDERLSLFIFCRWMVFPKREVNIAAVNS